MSSGDKGPSWATDRVFCRPFLSPSDALARARPVLLEPILELTVHVRAVPVGTRVACVFKSRIIQGGLIEEDGEIWDQAGNLVAISRQMALLNRG